MFRVSLLLKSTGEPNSSEGAPWCVIGVLKLENIRKSDDYVEAYFTTQDGQVVEAYADVIAVALDKARMRADSMRIAAGLLNVSRSQFAELGEPRLGHIVQQTANVISAEACSLWLRSGLKLRLRWENTVRNLILRLRSEDFLIERHHIHVNDPQIQWQTVAQPTTNTISES